MDEQATTVLTKFGQLIEMISGIDTTDEIYSCIAEFVPQILPADHVTITLYSNEEQKIIVRSIYGKPISRGGLIEGATLPAKFSYQKYAESVAVPIIYCPADNLGSIPNSDLHEAGIISVLIVPLISGLKIIGTINIASKSHSYLQSDKFRLEQISVLLANSIAHTEMFRSESATARHRLYAAHLEYLNELCEQLSRADSADEALDLVASSAKKLVNARRVTFCELEPNHEYVQILGLVGKTDDVRGTRISLKDSGLEDSLIHLKKKYNTDLIDSPVKAQRSLGESGIKQIWSFPILSSSDTRCCLNISSPATDLNSNDAMSVLDTLTRLLSSTLERITAQRETIIQATTDDLTGLCNRKEFNRKLESVIEVAARSKEEICILYFDLDLFKNINDTMGHVVGDQVLKEVSCRLRELMTAEDTLARIGGDEFMALLTNLSNRPPMENVAQTFIEVIGEPFNFLSQELTIGASIGICHYPKDGLSSNELIMNADIAMYKAKELGRNQYHLFTEELSRELSQRLQLEQDLIHALLNDQLSLVFQPQFDVKSMRVECVEVLVRWEHPTLGWIPPDVFIPIAENCGHIRSVTDWVLKNALVELSKMQKQFGRLRFAVNISAIEFAPQHKLYERLNNAILEAGVSADSLEIELTETAFLKHPEHASELAHQINASGISIAIDDFGTGYASLTYLIELPISCIKIDRSFVDGLESDLKKQAIVKGIVAISNGLKVTCLGEGVETQLQLEWLESVGCQCVQGYLLSRPVSAEKLVQVINTLNPDNVDAA